MHRMSLGTSSQELLGGQTGFSSFFSLILSFSLNKFVKIRNLILGLNFKRFVNFKLVSKNFDKDRQGGPNHLNNFCDSLLVGDATNQTLEIKPAYYFYGQITKFVKPNSVRVETTEYINSPTVSPIFGNAKDAMNVQVFRCGDKLASQKWDYDLASKQIKLSGTSFCLDDMDNGTESGTNVQLSNCANRLSQRWTFSEGRVVNGYSELCLAVQRWENDNGANMFQMPCDSNDQTLQWRLQGSTNAQLVSSLKAPDGTSLCAQAGRLSVNSVGFITPQGDRVFIVQNTGVFPISFKFSNDLYPSAFANLSVPERSIATYIF